MAKTSEWAEAQPIFLLENYDCADGTSINLIQNTLNKKRKLRDSGNDCEHSFKLMGDLRSMVYCEKCWNEWGGLTFIGTFVK